MKKNYFILVYFLIILVCSLNCKSKKDNKIIKYHTEGRFLVLDTYDSIGRIKQYFNQDTIPDGAMIEYYPNGKVYVWRWFKAYRKNPVCAVYYHNDGGFDTMKGRPYLGTAWDADGNLVIEFINPPQATIQVGYKDTYKGHKIKDILYDPELTDTISWVSLDEHKYEKDHKYTIYFYIVDTVQKRFLFQDSTHLAER